MLILRKLLSSFGHGNHDHPPPFNVIVTITDVESLIIGANREAKLVILMQGRKARMEGSISICKSKREPQSRLFLCS